MCQIADWQTLFRDLTSTDKSINDAAFKLAFDVLIPAVQAEDATALDKDIATIVKSFEDEKEPVRLQASGLLAGLAMLRSDATDSMKRAIPVWLSQFNDKNPRVRENALRSIVVLKPSVPAEAIPALLRLLREDDPQARPFAIGGLVRSSGTSADAARALAELMTPETPVETRRAVLQGFRLGGVTDPVLIAKLGEALRDRELVKDALYAAQALGPAGMPLRPLLVELAADERDKEVSNFAEQVLKRLERR